MGFASLYPTYEMVYYIVEMVLHYDAALTKPIAHGNRKQSEGINYEKDNIFAVIDGFVPLYDGLWQ